MRLGSILECPHQRKSVVSYRSNPSYQSRPARNGIHVRVGLVSTVVDKPISFRNKTVEFFDQVLRGVTGSLDFPQ